MKSILYALLAIFIFGCNSTGSINNANTETILLQSKEKNVSTEYLKQSVDIMKNRLKNFSSESFEISLMKEKNQIRVTFNNNLDMNTIANLLVQKGELSFHEVYDMKSLSEFLNGDDHLFSLLNAGNTNKLDAAIGCTSVSEFNEINDYIATIGLNQDFKFVWSKLSQNADVCLYALRVSDNHEGIISEADINSIKSTHNKTSAGFEVEIKFKQTAVDKWADITRNNINKSIAIVLDNSILYVPVIKSEIKSGIVTITGNFTETETKFIATLGSNGVLPVEFEIIK